MSLKSVDMQIAVHRNSDIGAHQQQLNQKPLDDQTMLAHQNEKNAVVNRHKSSEVNDTEKTNIRDDHSNNQNQSQNRDGKRKKKSDKEAPLAQSLHPYKGKHVDLSL